MTALSTYPAAAPHAFAEPGARPSLVHRVLSAWRSARRRRAATEMAAILARRGGTMAAVAYALPSEHHARWHLGTALPSRSRC